MHAGGGVQESVHGKIALFVLIALVSLALAFVNYSWVSWQPATCLPNNCFCESLRDGFIRQPINTYSNLAYVLVGLLILAHARHSDARANWMSSQRAYPIVFGGATVAIGVGSFFYHASLTFLGQWLDLMGMYLFAGFALLYNLARLRPMRGTTFALGYVAMNAMLGYLLIVNPFVRRQVFAGMIWVVLALEALVLLVERPRMKTRYLIGALVSLIVAYGVWMLDESRVWCDPTSVLQGHALWHFATAAAAGLLYLYYRSEDGKV